MSYKLELTMAVIDLTVAVVSLILIIIAFWYGWHGQFDHATFYLAVVILSERPWRKRGL